MEQTLRVLQMDNAQLNDYISGLMLENPMMEMETVSVDDSQAKLYARKHQWLEENMLREEEQAQYFSPEITHPEPKPAWPSQDLQQVLQQQLSALGQDQDDLAMKLCDFVEDNGYLSLGYSQLVERLDCSEDQLDRALALLRSLEPRGVGAFTLSECLKLQLPAGCQLACRLAEDFLPQVAAGQWELIARRLKTEPEAVKEAAAHLWSCNPRPGTACGREELPFYLTPDILVLKFRDRYEVLSCDYNIPQIRVSQDYLDLARHEADPTLRQYIKANLDRVNWLRQSVETRNQTLLRVARAVLARQERFLHFGPQYLQVLTVEELSAQLGMQERTIFHTLKNKYVQTPYGVFSLSNFVLRSSQDNTQSHLNQEIVKVALKEALDSERPENPYSDLKLCQILNARGYLMSVRMVEKYRQELGYGREEERLNLGIQEIDDCGCEEHHHHHGEDCHCEEE